MAVSTKGAEVKEKDESSGSRGTQELTSSTLLMHVILRLSPYISKDRIAKWSDKLNEEDLDYLVDLLVTPLKVINLCRNKFSTRLYGELLHVKSLPTIHLRVISVPNISNNKNVDANAVAIRKPYDGYYIYIGDRLNDSRVYVQASKGGGIKDMNQKILYCCTDGTWRFYVVKNSNNGHYMMKSDQVSQLDQVETFTWAYYDSTQQKHLPITLSIKTWNI